VNKFRGDEYSGAIFSECEKYRYSLWRIWDGALPLINFCMLNPSTADENTNDPTIERCKRRAEMMGYGGIVVTNVFAYRATDPEELKKMIKKSQDPVGLWNPQKIVEVSQMCDVTICGWGKYGILFNNQGGKTLGQLIFWNGKRKVRALRINKDGSPAHPLYIGYDVKPIPIDIKA